MKSFALSLGVALTLVGCAFEPASPVDVAIDMWTQAHGQPLEACVSDVEAAQVHKMGARELAATCESNSPELAGCLYEYDSAYGKPAQIAVTENPYAGDLAHEYMHVLFRCHGLGNTDANTEHTDPVWDNLM